MWVEEHQYRIFDTADNPTVGQLKESIAFRQDARVDLNDIVFETTVAGMITFSFFPFFLLKNTYLHSSSFFLNNNELMIEKTTSRKLEDGENIEKLLNKHKKVNYKLIWKEKGDAGISGPTAVKHEGHISLGAKGIEVLFISPLLF